jgi:hypothetical protein
MMIFDEDEKRLKGFRRKRDERAVSVKRAFLCVEAKFGKFVNFHRV